jgi:hypothetical protein
MVGDRLIEQSYYASLKELGAWDEINRGYHLYYYGDIDIDEEEVPPKDDCSSPAEATLRTLFRRLQRTQPEHLSLRRIELFTIRRFLETGRRLPSDITDASAIIKSAAKSVTQHTFGREFADSVEKEAKLIARLLSRL